MLKIRFTQTGKKNDHNYRLVVKEARSKRDGSAIEFLGYYHPNQGQKLQINSDRLNYWLNNGAQITPSAHQVVKDLISSPVQSTPKTKSTPSKPKTQPKTKSK